jgi:hypothetical protein
MITDPVAKFQLDCASLPSEGDKAGMLSDATHPLAKAFNTEDSRLCGGCQGQNYDALQDAGLDIRQEDRPMMSELLSAVAGSNSASGAALDPQKVDTLFKAMDEMGMLKDGKLTEDELKKLLEYLKDPASAPDPLRPLVQSAQADAGMQSRVGDGAEQTRAPSGSNEAGASNEAGKRGLSNANESRPAERSSSDQPAGGSQMTTGDARRAARSNGESEAEKAGASRRAARSSGESEAEKAGESRRAARSGDDDPSNRDKEINTVAANRTEAASGAGQATAEPAKDSGGASKSLPVSGSASGSDQSLPGVTSGKDTKTQSASTDTGVTRTPDVNQFTTIDPGQGPQMTIDKNGKFIFNKVVDDSFLPEKVRGEMKQAVHDNMHLDFFKSTFSSEADAYQFMVHMANLESARGTTLENGADAQNTGGGSAGYMHLHTTYGLEKQSWGSPLNNEGWSKNEVLSDYSKYTTLVMRSLDNNFKQVGGTPTQDDVAGAMSLWWTGKDSAQAGNYYLSALSGGTGVNHNTGSIYA